MFRRRIGRIYKIDPPKGEFSYLVLSKVEGETETETYLRNMEELRQLIPEVSEDGWHRITFSLANNQPTGFDITIPELDREDIHPEP